MSLFRRRELVLHRRGLDEDGAARAGLRAVDPVVAAVAEAVGELLVRVVAADAVAAAVRDGAALRAREAVEVLVADALRHL